MNKNINFKMQQNKRSFSICVTPVQKALSDKSRFEYNQIIYLQTTIFPFVNINLEQNKRSFSICVTPDIKWTIPGSR